MKNGNLQMYISVTPILDLKKRWLSDTINYAWMASWISKINFVWTHRKWIQKEIYLDRYIFVFMSNKNIIIYQYYEKFLPPKTTSPFHTTPWYLDKRITAEKGWDYNAAFHFGWYTMYDNSILFRDTVFIFSLVSWNTVFGM